MKHESKGRLAEEPNLKLDRGEHDLSQDTGNLNATFIECHFYMKENFLFL